MTNGRHEDGRPDASDADLSIPRKLRCALPSVRTSNPCPNPSADPERSRLCAKHSLEGWGVVENAQVQMLGRDPRPLAKLLPELVDELLHREQEAEQ